MIIPQELRTRLQDQHGIYVTEACDRCGQVLGPVRFTRFGDSGVWCSRQCRDGMSTREPKACYHCRARLPEGKRRGAIFCDAACKQAAHRTKPITQRSRAGKSSVTKPSIYAAFSPEKEPRGVSGHPEAFSALETKMPIEQNCLNG
jgi:hypothetical protein